MDAFYGLVEWLEWATASDERDFSGHSGCLLEPPHSGYARMLFFYIIYY